MFAREFIQLYARSSSRSASRAVSKVKGQISATLEDDFSSGCDSQVCQRKSGGSLETDRGSISGIPSFGRSGSRPIHLPSHPLHGVVLDRSSAVSARLLALHVHLPPSTDDAVDGTPLHVADTPLASHGHHADPARQSNVIRWI